MNLYIYAVLLYLTMNASMSITRRDRWRTSEDQYILKYMAYRFTFRAMSQLLARKAPVPDTQRPRTKDAIAKRSRTLRDRHELNYDDGQLNILKIWQILADQSFQDFNLDTERQLARAEMITGFDFFS